MRHIVIIIVLLFLFFGFLARIVTYLVGKPLDLVFSLDEKRNKRPMTSYLF